MLAPPAQSQTIILHLKNGDRLAGTIISEDTNHVVLTTSWSKELSVPLFAISSREIPMPAGSNAPAIAVARSNAPTPSGVLTNIVPSASPGTPVAITPVIPAPAQKTATPKHWKGELKIGADFLYGAKDQQIYYGRAKLAYEHPYPSNPKHYFRNILDYSLDYGRTEGNGQSAAVQSANRMDVSDKTDFDLPRRFYLYNLGGVGYDEVRKIDLHFEEGPGLGYHLLTFTNFVMNIELGANYQEQDRSGINSATKKFYFRLEQDVTWRLNKRLTFTEKAEYFPQVENLSQHRARIESNLSYGIWQNISLNVSLLDLYDSEPAQNVPNNDLQLRSSLGITF